MYDQKVADVCFLNGEYERAAAMYKEGASDGDMLAAFDYGYCLWRGIGVSPDAAEAKSYFSFARDLPGGAALYNLAMIYLRGVGVKRDYRRVFSYIRAAADLDCVEAQLYLGMAYTVGAIFEPDVIGISMIPFHKPEYRTPDTMLLSGDAEDIEADEAARFSVLSADQKEAFDWFRIAARHDPTYVDDLVAKGKYLYAKCYIDGLGTDHDQTVGARLMLAAGQAGSREAVQYLSENGITVERLLAAEKNSKIKK